MLLAPIVEGLEDDLKRAAAVGGEETRRAAGVLAEALGSAVRLRFMDALQQAAEELADSLPGFGVEVRLQGRDPVLTVTASAQVDDLGGRRRTLRRRGRRRGGGRDRPDHAPAPGAVEEPDRAGRTATGHLGQQLARRCRQRRPPAAGGGKARAGAASQGSYGDERAPVHEHSPEIGADDMWVITGRPPSRGSCEGSRSVAPARPRCRREEIEPAQQRENQKGSE